MFRIGVITDEISSDICKAVKVAKDLGLGCVELREVWGKNVKDLTDGDIRRIRRILRVADLEVVCIASPFFKCSIANEEEIREHFRLLRRVVEIAKLFDTELVRAFAFWKVGSLDRFWGEIVEKLCEAVDLCRSEAVTLALENEHATFVGTGHEARRVVEAVGSENLRVTWDPGNAFCAGEPPYPDGYREIRDHMVHMHVKDAVLDTRVGKHRFVAVGAGEIDYEGQLKALLDDGYEGCISIETHYRLPNDGEKSTRETFGGISRILGKLGVCI